MIAFFRRIVTDFGWQFSVVLFSIYALLKGTVNQISDSAALPYFKSLGVSGDKYQSFLIVSNVPWSLKAALGTLSDAYPLLGYHKASYVVLISLVGSAAFAVLGFVQFSPSTAGVAAFLCLLVQLQVAFTDLLTEGKYAEMMARNPESGTDLVCFAWGLMHVGRLLGAMVGGPMADRWNPRYIFIVCLPLAAQAVLPPLLGWYPDPRVPPARRGLQRHKLAAHPDLFKLSVAMTCASVAIGVAALLGSGEVQTRVSLVTAAVLCVLGHRWLPKTIRRANLYMFLTNMLYITTRGATDYWFVADETCVPGGPAFSFTFYNTYAALVGSAAGGVGVALFQRLLSKGSFRVAFWTTCLVKVAGSVSDIVMVKRWNRAVGIPDAAAFMVGDAVVQPIAVMLDLMPAVILTSKVCPTGMEASVYALLASYQNLGTAASRAIGVGLIDLFGIQTKAPCNFAALPRLILVGHVLLPLLAFPLVFVLIPDAKMTDELIEREGAADGDDGAGAGEVEEGAAGAAKGAKGDDLGKGGKGETRDGDGTEVVDEAEEADEADEADESGEFGESSERVPLQAGGDEG